MKTTIYSTHKFEEPYIIKANNGKHQLKFLENRLTEDTAILATGFKTVSLFTSDDASEKILEKLAMSLNFENISNCFRKLFEKCSGTFCPLWQNAWIVCSGNTVT